MSNIYFYRLSSGTHSDYQEITLCHTDKLTPNEFIQMHHSVLEAGKFTEIEDIADELCKVYKFTTIDPVAHIGTEDVYHRKCANIPLDEELEDGAYIDLDIYEVEQPVDRVFINNVLNN